MSCIMSVGSGSSNVSIDADCTSHLEFVLRCMTRSSLFSPPFLSTPGNRQRAVTGLWSLPKWLMSFASASVKYLMFFVTWHIIKLFIFPFADLKVAFFPRTCWMLYWAPHSLLIINHCFMRMPRLLGSSMACLTPTWSHSKSTTCPSLALNSPAMITICFVLHWVSVHLCMFSMWTSVYPGWRK